MATKSVIEIDVLDAKFQAFVKEFDKLKKSLDSMPKGWDKSSSTGIKSTQAVNKNIQDVKKSTDGVNKSLQEAKKNQDNFNKSAKDGNTALSTLANTTASIAKNMAGAVVSFTKFVALGAIGGGFGLAGVGINAGNERKQAQGYNITRGQLLTAKAYSNPYLDSDKLLENLSNILNDKTRRIELQKIGIDEDFDKTNAFDILPKYIEKALENYRLFKGFPQALEPLGITQNIDLDTLKRLDVLSKEEFNRFIGNVSKVDPVLQTKDETDAAFQNFIVNLKKAGKTVEIAITQGFEKLPDPLGKLSSAVAGAIKVFLESPQIGSFIEYAAKKIQEFGEYLASPKFKKDIKDFLDGIVAVATALNTFAKWFNNLFTFNKDEKPTVENKPIPKEETKPQEKDLGWYGKTNKYLDEFFRNLWGMKKKVDDKKNISSSINAP
jgi:hypothetical protein